MSDAKTVPEILLAGLMDKSCRLESFNFTSSMFDGQAGEGFEAIVQEWKDKRPDRIDPELIRAAGHDGVAEYLAGLRGYEPIGDECAFWNSSACPFVIPERKP